MNHVYVLYATDINNGLSYVVGIFTSIENAKQHPKYDLVTMDIEQVQLNQEYKGKFVW